MTTDTIYARLIPEAGNVWLRDDDLRLYELLTGVKFSEMLRSHDVVAYFGTGPGPIAAARDDRESLAHSMIVSSDAVDYELARRNWSGSRGVTSRLAHDHVLAVPSAVHEVGASVAVVSLRDREMDVKVLGALLQPMTSLFLLVLIYGGEMEIEQIVGVEEALLTWADDEGNRWESSETGTPRVRVYVR